MFPRIRSEQDGRLDVLVNNIWGGEKLIEWGKQFWEHSLAGGLLIQERAVKAHMITSCYGAPLMVAFAEAMAADLKLHGVAAIAASPGFLRSEEMLEHFGVAESNWRDAVASGILQSEHFAQSETPHYIGRGLAALAADPDYYAYSGKVLPSWTLSDMYGIRDANGTRPHWGNYAKKHGFL